MAFIPRCESILQALESFASTIDHAKPHLNPWCEIYYFRVFEPGKWDFLSRLPYKDHRITYIEASSIPTFSYLTNVISAMNRKPISVSDIPFRLKLNEKRLY